MLTFLRPDLFLFNFCTPYILISTGPFSKLVMRDVLEAYKAPDLKELRATDPWDTHIHRNIDQCGIKAKKVKEAVNWLYFGWDSQARPPRGGNIWTEAEYGNIQDGGEKLGEGAVGHKGSFGGGVSIVWRLRAYPLISMLVGFNTSWTFYWSSDLINFTEILRTSVSSSLKWG